MEGLEIKKLRVFDLKEEGKLFETLRSDDRLFEGGFGQNLVSIVNPGIIKGLHLHHKQTEYTTCAKGNILYVAIKETKRGVINKNLVIGEENPILVKTQPGIWHGYKVLGNTEAIVLYTMDRPYNPEDLDTEDKDPFFFGKELWIPSSRNSS